MKTVGEAREILSRFLQETGCYEICANCPLYDRTGCCSDCEHLVLGKGCQSPNLSCLAYTCGVLNLHLLRIPREGQSNALLEFTTLIYGLPREGYRGNQRRGPEEKVELQDPLEIRASLNSLKKIPYSPPLLEEAETE